MKQRFEYKTVNVGYGKDGSELLQYTLNDEAHRGWEIFSILNAAHGGYVLVFQREATKNVR